MPPTPADRGLPPPKGRVRIGVGRVGEIGSSVPQNLGHPHSKGRAIGWRRGRRARSRKNPPRTGPNGRLLALVLRRAPPNPLFHGAATLPRATAPFFWPFRIATLRAVASCGAESRSERRRPRGGVAAGPQAKREGPSGGDSSRARQTEEQEHD